MTIRMSTMLAIALAIAVGLVLLVRHQKALAQAQALEAECARRLAESEPPDVKKDVPPPLARPVRWEYHVLTLGENDDVANRDLGKFTQEGWEYVGVVQQAQPPHGAATQKTIQSFPGTATRLLFKRPRQ